MIIPKNIPVQNFITNKLKGMWFDSPLKISGPQGSDVSKAKKCNKLIEVVVKALKQ